jgi:predicted nucleotidyltransferase
MHTNTIDPQTRQAVASFAQRVTTRYPVSRLLLFGSRARQNHRADSDADVAVLLRGKTGNTLDTKLEMADIAYDILLETGIRIQALPIWETQWAHPETYSNPYLLRNIAREGIVL